MTRAPEDIFVGRERELTQLRTALDDALAGRGRVVLISGEAGMGKSRLVERFGEEASALGHAVHWGRALEHAGAPPYLPWTDVFGSVRIDRDITPDTVAASGADLDDLAMLLPELASGLSDDVVRSDTDASAQFRLFQSATWLLQHETAHTPLLIALDNLHWADDASLKLLGFLALELQESPVLVVCTYRESEAERSPGLSTALAQLSRHRRFTTVPMPPLVRGDVALLIEEAAGIAPPEQLIDVLHSHSEGSPFFTQNAIRLLQSRGELTSGAFETARGWEIGLPDGVREVIRSRIGALSEECALFLHSAAVTGRQFDLRVLTNLFPDLDEERLLELVEKAIAAALVRQSDEVADRFLFTHDLFRQTLESDLGLSRRVRLHARIASAMEKEFGFEDAGYAGKIAYHHRQAQSEVEPTRVAAACMRAGRVASGSHAYSEAAAHFGAAAEVLEDVSDERAMLAMVLDGKGRALYASARVPAAFEPLRRAFDIYLEEGMIDEALAVATVPLPAYGRAGLSAMLERALELAQPKTEVEALLLSRLGAARAAELGDLEGAQRAFDLAIGSARSTGSLRAEAWVYGRRAMMDPPEWNETIELAERSLEVVRPGEDPELEVHSRVWLAEAWAHIGEIGKTEEEARRALEVATRARIPMRIAQATQSLAWAMRLRGGWEETAQLENSIGFAMASRPTGPDVLIAGIYFATGQIDLAESAFSRSLEVARKLLVFGDSNAVDPEWPMWWHADLGSLAEITGDERFIEAMPARDHWTTIPDDWIDDTFMVRRFAHALRLYVAGAVAIVRGDRDSAGQALRIFRRHDFPVGHPRVLFGGSHRRFCGRLAVSAGLVEEALDHFEAARQFCSMHGLVYDHAWSCRDLAHLLIAEQSDLARAGLLIEEGENVAQEYGIRPLLDKMSELRGLLAPERYATLTASPHARSRFCESSPLASPTERSPRRSSSVRTP